MSKIMFKNLYLMCVNRVSFSILDAKSVKQEVLLTYTTLRGYLLYFYKGCKMDFFIFFTACEGLNSLGIFQQHL